MAEDPKKVEVVKAEVISEDPVEVALDVRIRRLEEGELEDDKNLKQALLSIVRLQDASLKHSVALGLFLAVCFFIASRALGA